MVRSRAGGRVARRRGVPHAGSGYTWGRRFPSLRPMERRSAVSVAVLLAAVVLGACSGGGSAATAPSTSSTTPPATVAPSTTTTTAAEPTVPEPTEADPIEIRDPFEPQA